MSRLPLQILHPKKIIKVFMTLFMTLLVLVGCRPDLSKDEFAVQSGAHFILNEIGTALVLELERAVQPTIERTHNIANWPGIAESLLLRDRDELEKLANQAIQDGTELDAIAFFGADSQILAINTVYKNGQAIDVSRVRSVMERRYDERPIITSCSQNSISTSALEFQRGCDITPAFFDSSGLSVAYSVAVFSPETGDRVGVVSTRLDFSRLSSLIQDREVGGEDETAFFVSDTGEFFDERYNSGDARPPVPVEKVRQIVSGLTELDRDRDFSFYDDDQGGLYLNVFSMSKWNTLDGGGIHVMLIANKTWLLREYRQAVILSYTLWTVIGLLFVITVMTILITRIQRRGNARINLANESADVANQSRSEFLANMSHEIRTPMTAILGFAENLLDVDQPESERVKGIHTIRRNGDYLLGLINDILDFSKFESGKMQVEFGNCRPCQVIADVASIMHVSADAKGLLFSIEYIGAIPETIQSDVVRLRQILINIVGNAIKFTDAGSVHMVTRLVDSGDAPYLQIDIVDEGRGMTKAQLGQLYQPFMQADTSITRKFGGTGLSLTISKRFAELLGGDITVSATQLGVGTTFRVSISTGPLVGVKMLDDPMSATVVDAPVARAALADLDGCRILLAEDNRNNQVLIAGILKKANAEVTVESNGQLAFDAALAARDEGKAFDVILMDMQMPVMDGYETTKQLRKRGYAGPIIAVTAHAMACDREKCIEAGCDDYTAKPIDRAKLFAAIIKQLAPCEASSPSTL